MPSPKRCHTVGELVAELSKLDPSTPLLGVGPDSGGYDVSMHPFAYVVEWTNGAVSVEHLECEAGNLKTAGRLTFAEFRALYPDFDLDPNVKIKDVTFEK